MSQQKARKAQFSAPCATLFEIPQIEAKDVLGFARKAFVLRVLSSLKRPQIFSLRVSPYFSESESTNVSLHLSNKLQIFSLRGSPYFLELSSHKCQLALFEQASNFFIAWITLLFRTLEPQMSSCTFEQA